MPFCSEAALQKPNITDVVTLITTTSSALAAAAGGMMQRGPVEFLSALIARQSAADLADEAQRRRSAYQHGTVVKQLSEHTDVLRKIQRQLQALDNKVTRCFSRYQLCWLS